MKRRAFLQILGLSAVVPKAIAEIAKDEVVSLKPLTYSNGDEWSVDWTADGSDDGVSFYDKLSPEGLKYVADYDPYGYEEWIGRSATGKGYKPS